MSARNPSLLVVEDKPFIAMMIEDSLNDLGYAVIGPAASVEEALRLLRDHAVVGALLDINLGAEERSYPVADALEARSLPFIFLTGYGADGIEQRYAEAPTLQKPFADGSLSEIVERVFGARDTT